MICDIRNYSDTTYCVTCGSQWDYGDFDHCKLYEGDSKTKREARRYVKAIFAQVVVALLLAALVALCW